MTNKIALITGGSRGLGRASALAAAQHGIDVILTYRSQRAEADAVVAEIVKLGAKAVALPLDVSESSQFAPFAAEVTRVLNEVWKRDTFDFLVNNAGTGLHKPVTETTEDEFDFLVRLHLKGPFFLTQTLLPTIADGGRILNVSSGLARFTFPGASAYAMMKGGIEVFSRYLAKELGARGIRANTLAPGAIATDFNGGTVRDNQAVHQMVAGTTALGRVGEADDIGGVVAALLGDEMGWINGQRIEASGGMML
ncbi:SDR family NAD(P)-dependent oxidoreductase [Pandoraea sputorum]|uniref:3-oxoacyl-[acyl-carrier-protein] reductase FabG n=1 Tax=Pandoraea sputorum TaxID=93222 RepID=A0A239SC33_9BURK|nr:SDR family oxidoreductase [Pandoraea sputorum]AJC16374.1 short-chain dehydrogenase [Pandoraea sputorum]BET11026.1 SDR family oxidoreductase [Pandoraea sputorum]SNU82980.1 3-oxoacyl-[acyl-carrier-protein] reductase FabG [Pandoraea sputorum]VVE13914.1 short-chain dehydrogenase [Pandoraea sputorum]